MPSNFVILRNLEKVSKTHYWACKVYYLLGFAHKKFVEIIGCLIWNQNACNMNFKETSERMFVAVQIAIMSNSFVTHGLALQAHFPWYFPGKNMEMGCHLTSQDIFPTQGSSHITAILLLWQAYSLPLSHQSLRYNYSCK